MDPGVTSSDYDDFTRGFEKVENIHTAGCQHLYGLILLNLDTYPVFKHPKFHDFFSANIEAWAMDKSSKNIVTHYSKFQPGDIVYLNGIDHVCIATGEKDQVLSLWNYPKFGVCITDLQTLEKYYEEKNRDKPMLTRKSVSDVFLILQKIQLANPSASKV